MKKTILVLILSISLSQLFAQQWEWTKPEKNPFYYDTLFFDKKGATDGEYIYYAGGQYQYYGGTIFKQASLQGAKLWEHRFNGAGKGLILKDSILYVTGMFVDSLVLQGYVYKHSGGHSFIACLNTDGQVAWVRIILEGAGSFRVNNMVADKQSNLYLAVRATSITTDNGDSIKCGNSQTVFLKLDKTGKITWNKSEKNSSPVNQHIGVDAQGSIYTAFTFQDSLIAGNNLFIDNCTEYSCGDIVLSKYDETGKIVWANHIRTSRPDYVKSMVVSPEGNSYLSGSYSDTIQFGEINVCSNNVNYSPMYIAKYNNDGKCVWAMTSRGISGSCSADNLLYYPDGSIYLCGSMYGNWNNNPSSYSVLGNDTLLNKDIFISKIKDLKSVGIQLFSIQEFDIEIYPNPTQKNIEISAIGSKWYDNIQVKIMDSKGQCIHIKACKTNNGNLHDSINLTGYPKGLYFIEITDNSQKAVRKIILN